MAVKRSKATAPKPKAAAKARKSPRKTKESGGKTLLAGAAIGSAAIAAALLFIKRPKKKPAKPTI